MKSRFSAKTQDSATSKKTAILLTNLGSPDEPTTGAVRRYLREFLSDRRVVEIPRLLWLTILYAIILVVRPAKSAKLYQSIWTKQGAPLLTNTKAQAAKVAAKLQAQYGDDIVVGFAMRYGNPSVANELQKFQQQGVDNIVVLPLYPQYAGPTTGSTFDAISKELQQWRYVPALHFLNTYHHNPLYIKALATTVSEHVAKFGKPDKLVLSFHGMPELFRQWGDPYYDFCLQTTELLKNILCTAESGFVEEDVISTFQSRFGKAQWLQPYTDETLEKLPEQGVKHIAIMSPAFSSDCLETLEELEFENREIFMEAGGEQYHYIAALNERDDHIDAIVSVLTPTLNAIS